MPVAGAGDVGGAPRHAVALALTPARRSDKCDCAFCPWRRSHATLTQFIDDVEFWFKPGPGSRVEYRSASRIGESDGDINRKRIRAIRKELEKKGWASVGY